MNTFFVFLIFGFMSYSTEAFSIMNKLNIEKLKPTWNISDDESFNSNSSDVQIGDLGNESIEFYIKPGDDLMKMQLENESSDQSVTESNTELASIDQEQWPIPRQKLMPQKRSFFGLIIIPYIICYFATKGFWPFYPTMLQYQVNEMGKKLFSLGDDRIRQFCCGKFNFQETCLKPVFYKGYFVPVDISTDCPPFTTQTTVKPTQPVPSAQSWGEEPAKIAAKLKPSKVDVEVFGKTSTPRPENIEQPNINIEIHNVFSFGTNSSFPARNDEIDSKISQQDQQHSSLHKKSAFN